MGNSDKTKTTCEMEIFYSSMKVKQKAAFIMRQAKCIFLGTFFFFNSTFSNTSWSIGHIKNNQVHIYNNNTKKENNHSNLKGI